LAATFFFAAGFFAAFFIAIAFSSSSVGFLLLPSGQNARDSRRRMRRIRKRPRHGDAGVVFGDGDRCRLAARFFGGDGACNHRGGCRRGRAACVPTFGPEFYCRLSQPPCVGRKLNTRFRAVNNPAQNFFVRVMFEAHRERAARCADARAGVSARALASSPECECGNAIAVFPAAAARLSIRARASRRFDATPIARDDGRDAACDTTDPGAEKNFRDRRRFPASHHPKCAKCANSGALTAPSRRARSTGRAAIEARADLRIALGGELTPERARHRLPRPKTKPAARAAGPKPRRRRVGRVSDPLPRSSRRSRPASAVLPSARGRRA
jgi:hypothetical protein